MQPSDSSEVEREIRALHSYRLMAGLWFFPFLGGIAILYPLVRREIERPNARNDPGVEHWIALVIIMLEPIFILMAKPWKKADLSSLKKD